MAKRFRANEFALKRRDLGSREVEGGAVADASGCSGWMMCVVRVDPAGDGCTPF